MGNHQLREVGIRYGFSLSAFLLIYYLIVFLLIKKEAYALIGDPNLFLLGVMIFLSHLSYKKACSQGLSYQEGLVLGGIVTGISTLIIGIVSGFYLTMVNNTLIPIVREKIQMQLENMNFKEEELELMISMTKSTITPSFLSFSRVVASFIGGVVLTLLISLFTRKKIDSLP